MLKFKRIATRLYVVLLPITVISLMVVLTVSTIYSVSGQRDEIQEKMEANLDKSVNEIYYDLSSAVQATNEIANEFGVMSEHIENMETYNTILSNCLNKDNLFVALGIFLEPYVVSDEVERSNTYVCWEDGEIGVMDVTDMEFWNTDWYMELKETGQPAYLEAYVDEILGKTMISYVVPIFNQAGEFIGAVNADISLDIIQEEVSSIAIGETGYATLVTTTGAYVTNTDSSKIIESNMVEDELYTSDISKLLEGGSGRIDCTESDGKEHRLYYSTLEDVGWVLVIDVEEQEMMSNIKAGIVISVITIFVAILICIIAIFVEARYLSNNLKKGSELSLELANGNFTVEPIRNHTRDEIGIMIQSLNKMLDSNKEILNAISDHSVTVGSNCNVLGDAVEVLKSNFTMIEEAILHISSSMMDNSATIEEVTASVEEVTASINFLAQRAGESESLAHEIRERATGVEAESTESYNQAMELTKQFEQRMKVSIEDSKVVDDIGMMATAISEIAEEINLLSLNASIEAARAGEHGRGFAVVANEIGSLANQTADTVQNIQQLVDKVEVSVRNLSEDSKELIQFISDKVTPDYNAFMNTGRQYGEDAESIGELSKFISDLSKELDKTVGEVSTAIQSIAEASQDAAQEATVINDNVEQVSEHVDNVGHISGEQREVARQLDELVGKYQL